MRSEDGYNESLHILVANVQAGANGRAERDVAAEMLRDVARPDRRIPVGSQKRCLWPPRQIKDLDIFFENTACFLSQKRCPQPRKFSEKLSFGMSRPT